MKQAIVLGISVALLYVVTLAAAATPNVCAHLLGTTETHCGLPYGTAVFDAGHIVEISNTTKTSVSLRGWAYDGCDYTDILDQFLNAGQSVQSMVWPPPYQPHHLVLYGWCPSGYPQPSCVGGQLAMWCQP